MENLKEIAVQLTEIALTEGIIEIDPVKKFHWKNGDVAPIYTNDRLFLRSPDHRKLITHGFCTFLGIKRDMMPEIITGVATAGIPYASLLADALGLPYQEISDETMSYFKRKKVLIVEGTISTGESLARAINTIRRANGYVSLCFSIFDYEFSKTKKVFAGKTHYGSDSNNIIQKCEIFSLFTYPEMFYVGKTKNLIKRSDRKKLEEWYLPLK